MNTETQRRQDTPKPHPGDPAAPRATTIDRQSVARLRRMGQGIALPIAAMPAAGLMLRLGQDDLLGRVNGLRRAAAVISGAGSSVLDYLPILFAIGIGFGLSRSKDAAGPVLACMVSYLVLSRAVLVLNPLPAGQLDTPPARWPYGALTGIIAALLATAIWKRVDGRRRIPPFAAYGIVAAAALGVGALLGLAYPAVDQALTASASAVADHPVIGGALFGFFNRLLLPLGLHHVPNAIVWYVAGDCGHGVRGDIPCFFQQHDPHAGIFTTGFFPVSMAGLPAAAIAMWRSALPEHRRRVGALLLPAAAMSAIAGITEPIELAFAFTAAPLYLLHAALTGASLALVNALGIHSSFVFSAGALDYAFNYPISRRPLLLLPVCAVYGALYYGLFRFAITRFNLPTPGRAPAAEPPTAERGTEHGDRAEAPARGAPASTVAPTGAGISDPTVQAAHYGLGNIFPVVLLDARPRWQLPLPLACPQPVPEPAEVLAVRWTGPDGDLVTAPRLLEQAVRQAPDQLTHALLSRYRDDLPASLFLITLPPSALMGPWAERPGAARGAVPGRAA